MPQKVSFGEELVSPEEKTRRVGEVFSSVARRYDLMNDLMSAGMHRLWKDRFVARVKPRPGEEILDMAGGTGDVAFRMARRGAHVTVADINADMLEVGRKRAEVRGLAGLKWQVENAEVLTFGDATFDAYTIVFGIRNVTDILAALKVSALLMFIECVKELPATLLLRSLNTETLATFLYAEASRGVYEDGAIAALGMAALGLLPIMVLSRSANFRRSSVGA